MTIRLLDRISGAIIGALLLALVAVLAGLVDAGPLDPPGPPGPTMKTLQDVEPRTPISSAPFVITQPGSYYLTKNLSVASGSGIAVSVDNVTIDLMGFELVGGPATTDGIAAGARTNITVKNGIVRTWGADAISLGNRATVSGVRVEGAASAGIRVQAFSIVTACSAISNNHGIVTNTASLVSDCGAHFNTGTGIYMSSGSLANCHARDNGTGISASASQVTGCVALSNADGIVATSGSTISDCGSFGNTDDGVVSSDSVVTGCAAMSNGGDGFDLVNSTLSECTANDNGTGIRADRSEISGCSAEDNTGDGIFAVANSTINDCDVSFNGDDGVEADFSEIINCVASENVAEGIEASQSVVEVCRAHSNGASGVRIDDSLVTGCGSTNNDDDGFLIGTGSVLRDNSARANGVVDGAGFHATGAGNRIEGNHATSNDRGYDVDVGGNTIVLNSAYGNGPDGTGALDEFDDVVAAADLGPVTSAESASNPWSNVVSP